MIIMKNLASCIPLSIESICARPCSSTVATSEKQVTNPLYFVVFNLILIPQLEGSTYRSGMICVTF